MKLKNTVAITLSFFLLFSCTKDESINSDSKNEIPQIKMFKFEVGDNNNLSKDISATINPEEKKINVAFPPYTSLKNLAPTITVSDGAIVSPNSNVQQDFSEPIVYTLSGEGYETVDYNLYASVEDGEKSAILNFSFLVSKNPRLEDDITTLVEDKIIEVEISDRIDISALVPSIEISEGASISPADSQAVDFTKDVKYIVTAQDGVTQTEYIVQVNTLSSDTKITAFQINYDGVMYEADINNNTFEISLSLPYQADLSSLTPIIEVGERASVSPSSDTPQDFNKPVTYEVIAEDGSKQLYEVSVKNLSASENDRAVLKELYDANKKYHFAYTYLTSWDFDANSMDNWEGVTVTNGRVTQLALSLKYLNEIPKSIGQLSELTSLTIIWTSLSEVPPEIGNLRKLELLTLSDNNLSSLPAEIGKLKSLKSLFIGDNQLEELPAEIGQMSKLIWLQVHENNIKELPLEIADIPNLLILDITNNPLTSIPQVICDMKTEGNLSISITKDDEDTCN